jgi:gliding motility-associated-like protein
LPADFIFSNLTKFTPSYSKPLFNWNFGPGTGISYGYGNQNYRYTEPGKFQIKLTAQDTLYKNAITTDWGRICYKSDSVEIFTQNLIPSLVTSNGDGKNDFLSIQGMRPNTFSMKLYNRWGKLVGEQDPFDANVGWDPKDVGPGSYYYILTEKRSGKTIVSWLTISKD